MKTIYKYKLNYVTEPEVVRLPKGSKVTQAAVQNKKVVMWAVVDTLVKDMEERVFVLAMTGQELPWDIKEIFNTFIIEESGIVLTLLELSGVKGFDPDKDSRIPNNS